MAMAVARSAPAHRADEAAARHQSMGSYWYSRYVAVRMWLRAPCWATTTALGGLVVPLVNRTVPSLSSWRRHNWARALSIGVTDRMAPLMKISPGRPNRLNGSDSQQLVGPADQVNDPVVAPTFHVSDPVVTATPNSREK